MVEANKETHWLVYIILADDGSLYTGITTDIKRRWHQHSDNKGGARYFRGRSPIEVVYLEGGHNRSSASKREAAIKGLSRPDKELLILSGDNNGALLASISYREKT